MFGVDMLRGEMGYSDVGWIRMIRHSGIDDIFSCVLSLCVFVAALWVGVNDLDCCRYDVGLIVGCSGTYSGCES